MDLGRPISRHTIRRPHEVIDLDAELTIDEPVADDQQVASETPEH